MLEATTTHMSPCLGPLGALQQNKALIWEDLEAQSS